MLFARTPSVPQDSPTSASGSGLGLFMPPCHRIVVVSRIMDRYPETAPATARRSGRTYLRDPLLASCAATAELHNVEYEQRS